MSHFRVPPPVFIGGGQPYAPRLGLPQSGPVPQSPPLRGAMAAASFSLIVAAWQPYAPQQPQTRIAALIPAAATSSQPPGLGLAQRNVLQSWWSDTTTVVSLASFASQLQADLPPVRSGANLALIIRDWTVEPYPSQGYTEFAPLLSTPLAADQPPVPGKSTLALTIAAWTPPHFIAQGYADLAPLLPASVTPDAPPKRSLATFGVLLDSWRAPFIAAQGFADVAPLIPVVTPDAPPLRSGANASIILDSWRTTYAVNRALFVPAPIASQPPTINRVALMTIDAMWWKPYEIPLIRARLSQSGPVVVISVPISGQTATVNGPVSGTVNGPESGTVHG